MAPVVEQIAEEYRGKIKVVGIDVHNNPDSASQFGIFGIPALLFFRDGKEVSRLVGAMPKAKVLGEVQKLAVL